MLFLIVIIVSITGCTDKSGAGTLDDTSSVSPEEKSIDDSLSEIDDLDSDINLSELDEIDDLLAELEN